MAPQWADGPFELISTPRIKDGYTKETTNDFIETASLMAVLHNTMIRGLNSIYVQAPNVEPSEYKNFIGYSLCWYDVVHVHHDQEEMNFFPNIEGAVGEKGIMDVNVEQHHAFQDGMTAYKRYLEGLKGNELAFSGKKLREIIDSFGPALIQHLHQEIPTLVKLSKYGDKLPLGKLFEEEGQEALGTLSKTEALMFFWTNMDKTHEGGIYASFPEGLPTVARYLFSYVYPLWNSGYWKFASCTATGHPKPLHAVSKG